MPILSRLVDVLVDYKFWIDEISWASREREGGGELFSSSANLFG